LWLRSSRFSPRPPCVAALAVSLYGRAAVLPSAGLDYHLVHTLIPVRPLANSLGIFFCNTPVPSPFCNCGFRSRPPRSRLAGLRRGIWTSYRPLLHPPQPLKAGYTAPNASPCFSIACRSSLRRRIVAHIGATATTAGLLEKRVVARMPLRIALPPGGRRPRGLYGRIPSTSPRLGIGGQHQRRHRCAH